MTTKECNLACPYCYIQQDQSEMPPSIYNQIYLAFTHFLESKELDHIYFRIAGGEPLLCFDSWWGWFDKMKSEYPDKVSIAILTNLTVLTNEMLHWFDCVDCSFGISLDSLIYSKPYHSGESSAPIVMANLERLINHRGTKNLNISTVISSTNVSDLPLLADYIGKNNLNWALTLDHYFCGEIDHDMLVENLYEVVDVLGLYDYDLINKFKFNNIMLNSSSYEGCTAGEKLITIGVDGGVYACQTLMEEGKPLAQLNKYMLESLRSQKEYKIGYNYALPNDCKKCSISDICGGGCKLHNTVINHNHTCDLTKKVVLYTMKKYIQKIERM